MIENPMGAESRSRPAAIGVLSALALLGWSTIGAAQPAEPSSSRGFTLAQQKCAACHALTAVAPRPPIGAPAFPDIGRRFEGPALEARMAVVLREGHYAMPPRRVSAAERRDIAAFIRERADHLAE